MDQTSITELLNRAGSDKGRWYKGMYDVLLQPYRYAIDCMIEIGIGTPAVMAGYCSEDYRVGASLRCWRDFLPNAQVFGLDIDPNAQLTTEEPRIRTYQCDSTDS